MTHFVRERLPWIVYSCMLLLLLADRVRVLGGFAFLFTDKDQVLMWTAAYELLHGRIHEPRFYGQAYNSMLEGLLAAPLVAARIPFHEAVPIVSVTLGLAPFIALAECARRSGQMLSAIAALLLPVALPIEYALITSMPRGFVTGIAVAAVAACLSVSRPARGSSFVSGLTLIVGASLYPNAVFLAVPVACLIALRHGRSLVLHAWGLAGIATGAVLHYLSVAYYRTHPSHLVVDPTGGGMFSVAALWTGLSHLDRHLGPLTPIVPHAWLLGLMFFALAAGLGRARAWKPLSALVVGLASIVASLAYARAHEGSPSIYWHWARAYLAVPVLMVWAGIWLERARPEIGHRARAALGVTLLVTGLVLTIARTRSFDAVVRRDVVTENPADVRAWPVRDVYDRCAALETAAAQHDARLVVFQFVHKVLAYSCEPLLQERIKTLMVREVVPERRTWRVREEVERPGPRTVLLVNVWDEQMSRAAAIGVATGPAFLLNGVPTVAARLPPAADLFATLTAMGMPGAQALEARARPPGAR